MHQLSTLSHVLNHCYKINYCKSRNHSG